jgi:nitrilase
MSAQLKVGLAQIAPVCLDRDRTLAKVADFVNNAARAGCRLVAFGEALVPGYPFWVELTNGARFEDSFLNTKTWSTVRKKVDRSKRAWGELEND